MIPGTFYFTRVVLEALRAVRARYSVQAQRKGCFPGLLGGIIVILFYSCYPPTMHRVCSSPT